MSKAGFTFQPKPERNHFVAVHWVYKLITDGKAATAAVLNILEYLAEGSLVSQPDWIPGDPIPDTILIDCNVQNALLLTLLDGLVKESTLKTKIKLLEKLGFIDTWIEAGRYRKVRYRYRAIANALEGLDLENTPRFEGAKSKGSKIDPSKNDGLRGQKLTSRGQKLTATNLSTNLSTNHNPPLPPKGGGPKRDEELVDEAIAPLQETLLSGVVEPDSPLTEPVKDSSDGLKMVSETQKSSKKSRRKKKEPFPDSKLDQLKAIWSEVRLEDAWSIWGTTNQTLRNACQKFWTECEELELDPVTVFRIALEQAKKTDFWGKRPPDQSGQSKWTPGKLIKQQKDHLFDFYDQAMTPTDEHPYSELRRHNLADVWVGPDKFDFDPDLMTVFRKNREAYHKPTDDLSLKQSMDWIIGHKISLLQSLWNETLEYKQRRAESEQARQAAIASPPQTDNIERTPEWYAARDEAIARVRGKSKTDHSPAPTNTPAAIGTQLETMVPRCISARLDELGWTCDLPGTWAEVTGKSTWMDLEGGLQSEYLGVLRNSVKPGMSPADRSIPIPIEFQDEAGSEGFELDYSTFGGNTPELTVASAVVGVGGARVSFSTDADYVNPKLADLGGDVW